jgi:hypothetical protein
MENLQVCPKFEAAFELLGKRWTGFSIMNQLITKKLKRP